MRHIYYIALLVTILLSVDTYGGDKSIEMDTLIHRGRYRIEREKTTSTINFNEKRYIDNIRVITIPLTYKPLFAIKTNLLYDIITVANAKVEIPIGRYFSLSGGWNFVWTTRDNGKSDSKRGRTQLSFGDIEARYWLGERDKNELLTGWYVGIYAGGGIYDLERDGKGYQGEFVLAGGISGGYAHKISSNGRWRLEYTLGIGIMHTKYTRYESSFESDMRWHALREYNGKYNWFGPTKAEVSLVLMLTKNRE